MAGSASELPYRDYARMTEFLWRGVMEVFLIPVDGRYLVYRPLLPLAFVVNAAMAGVAVQLAADPEADAPDRV